MIRNVNDRNLIIDFLENVLEESVITDESLSVEELEGYDLKVYTKLEMEIIKEYFIENEEFIYAAYLQKKINEI